MTFHVAELAHPGRVLTPDEASWVARRVARLRLAEERTRSDDPVEDQAWLATYLRLAADEATGVRVGLVAVAGPPRPDQGERRFGLPVLSLDAALAGEPGEVIGLAYAFLDARDDPTLADGADVVAAPARRRQGLGSLVAGELLRICREQGRSSVLGISRHGGDALLLPPLPVPGSTTALPADGAAAFALALGFEPAQAVRVSRAPLPVVGLGALAATAAAAAADYDVESFVGPTQDRHLPAVAELHRQLRTDAPSGGTVSGDGDWDPERVRAREVLFADLGYERHTCLAIHRATGAVAGMTLLDWKDNPAFVASQGDTVVHRDHRGHRLGLLLKAGNLRQLADRHPEARWVETSNAGDNAPMLAINDALGFRPHAAVGVWKRAV